MPAGQNNTQQIQKLKEKLKAGGLSQDQINSISQRIQSMGGKVNAGNFPPAVGTNPEQGQDDQGGTGKKWKDMDPEAIKKSLYKGGLSQQEYDRAMQVLKNKGGKIDPARYPTPGQTQDQFKQASPDAKPPGWKDDGKGGKKKDGTPAAGTVIDQDAIAADTKRQLADATTYGDEMVNKYITKDMFGKLSADTSPEMKAALERLDALAANSGNLSPEEQEALSNLRAGLAGYDAPEVQAMREGATQEINRQYKGQLDALRMQQARNVGMGRQGGAAFAQSQDLNVNKRQELGNLERDLLIKNADEVQNRKQAFASLVRSTEDARFGRQNASNSLYTGALGAEEQARSGREQFNVNQDTNRGLASAGIGLSSAGTYIGTQQGNVATAGQIDWANYLKDKDAADRAFAEQMAKQYWNNTKKMFDQQMNYLDQF